MGIFQFRIFVRYIRTASIIDINLTSFANFRSSFFPLKSLVLKDPKSMIFIGTKNFLNNAIETY